jgi:hypothetical protein
VAELYHAVAVTMAELGDADAAWVAANRSTVAAAHAGDAVIAAASGFRLGHAFLSAGRLEQAGRTVEVAACCRRHGPAIRRDGAVGRAQPREGDHGCADG